MLEDGILGHFFGVLHYVPVASACLLFSKVYRYQRLCMVSYYQSILVSSGQDRYHIAVLSSYQYNS